jgi:hypothetical protein
LLRTPGFSQQQQQQQRVDNYNLQQGQNQHGQYNDNNTNDDIEISNINNTNGITLQYHNNSVSIASPSLSHNPTNYYNQDDSNSYQHVASPNHIARTISNMGSSNLGGGNDMVRNTNTNSPNITHCVVSKTESPHVLKLN